MPRVANKVSMLQFPAKFPPTAHALFYENPAQSQSLEGLHRSDRAIDMEVSTPLRFSGPSSCVLRSSCPMPCPCPGMQTGLRTSTSTQPCFHPTPDRALDAPPCDCRSGQTLYTSPGCREILQRTGVFPPPLTLRRALTC